MSLKPTPNPLRKGGGFEPLKAFLDCHAVFAKTARNDEKPPKYAVAKAKATAKAFNRSAMRANRANALQGCFLFFCEVKLHKKRYEKKAVRLSFLLSPATAKVA